MEEKFSLIKKKLDDTNHSTIENKASLIVIARVLEQLIARCNLPIPSEISKRMRKAIAETIGTWDDGHSKDVEETNIKFPCVLVSYDEEIFVLAECFTKGKEGEGGYYTGMVIQSKGDRYPVGLRSDSFRRDMYFPRKIKPE